MEMIYSAQPAQAITSEMVGIIFDYVQTRTHFVRKFCANLFQVVDFVHLLVHHFYMSYTYRNFLNFTTIES